MSEIETPKEKLEIEETIFDEKKIDWDLFSDTLSQHSIKKLNFFIKNQFSPFLDKNGMKI